MPTRTISMPSPARAGGRLAATEFAAVVAATPLVSIDLIVSDRQGAVLLGLRNNPPAKDYWFVPGGRVRKNETLTDARLRLCREELGWTMGMDAGNLDGVYEHFYDTDFRAAAGASTHYLVLAYRLQADPAALRLPYAQHSSYQWLQPDRILLQPTVHAYTRAYFMR